MIAFLLFCILPCLCKPLRTFTAFMFCIAVLLLVWNWPSAANDLRIALMKRLLLIAAALLALTGAASAVEMPKELRGVWSLDIDRHVYTREGECTVRSGFLIDCPRI